MKTLAIGTLAVACHTEVRVIYLDTFTSLAGLIEQQSTTGTGPVQRACKRTWDQGCQLKRLSILSKSCKARLQPQQVCPQNRNSGALPSLPQQLPAA